VGYFAHRQKAIHFKKGSASWAGVDNMTSVPLMFQPYFGAIVLGRNGCNRGAGNQPEKVRYQRVPHEHE